MVCSRFWILFCRLRGVASWGSISGLSFFKYCRRHGGMVSLLVTVLVFVSSKSGTIFHTAAKKREKETIYIWNVQYQSSERLIVLFPVPSLLHSPSPLSSQICDTEKEIKEQHKELRREWLQRSLFYREKNPKTWFFFPKAKIKKSFRKKCHNANLSIEKSLQRIKSSLGRSENSSFILWEQGWLFSLRVRA